jgi:Pyridine nucleotide-disulphide oxidoreductase, dimerisation domain
VDYTALPRVTFTSPAIASAGLTEAELVRSGVACDCRVLPLGAVPRAIVNQDTRGVVTSTGGPRVSGGEYPWFPPQPPPLSWRADGSQPNPFGRILTSRPGDQPAPGSPPLMTKGSPGGGVMRWPRR